MNAKTEIVVAIRCHGLVHAVLASGTIGWQSMGVRLAFTASLALACGGRESHSKPNEPELYPRATLRPALELAGDGVPARVAAAQGTVGALSLATSVLCQSAS